MALAHKTLKWGVYTSPQSGDNEIERYIIENKYDFASFLCRFPVLKHAYGGVMLSQIEKTISEGKILIFTDTNPASGLPSYCFEETNGDPHPCCFHRVRLGEILT